MWTMFSKPQTPARTAEIFSNVINTMKNSDRNWPLDTMVEIGNLLNGPSRNEESEIAHFAFQDYSNSAKKMESRIRNLSQHVFTKYIWKLEKAGFNFYVMLSHLLF